MKREFGIFIMEKENKNHTVDRYVEKIAACTQRFLSPKLIAIGLTACYLISLIPLLVLSWYNYPSADDYTNGASCYHVWNSGHSILGVLATAFGRTVEEWFTWRGCFTSSFLSSIPPNIYGEGWYKVTAWLVLGMLTVSLVVLLHMILARVLGADRWTSLSIIMLTLLISVQCTPGRVEVFYWYSGAINYTFMYGMSLLFYGSMIGLAIHRGKRKKISVVVSSILGFLVSGGNQMTMLNAAILLLVCILLITYHKKWAQYKVLAVPMSIFYIGFLLSVAAPGNYIRAEAANGMNPLKSVLISFYYCLDLVVNEWMTWPVIVALIAMIPLFLHVIRHTKFQFPYPLVVAVFGYCLVSAMITPPLFAVGNIEAGRLQGTIFLMFILVLVLCTGYVTGWAGKKYESIRDRSTVSDTEKDDRYGRDASLCLAGSLVFLMFGIILTLIPDPRYFTSVSATLDCVNGSARAYGEALRTRAELYRDNQGNQVVVESLPEHPELLFFSDITDYADDWTNRGVARFYDLESVVLETDNASPGDK